MPKYSCSCHRQAASERREIQHASGLLVTFIHHRVGLPCIPTSPAALPEEKRQKWNSSYCCCRLSSICCTGSKRAPNVPAELQPPAPGTGAYPGAFEHFSVSAFRETSLIAVTLLTPESPAQIPQSDSCGGREEQLCSSLGLAVRGGRHPATRPVLACPCPKAHCPEQTSPPWSFKFPFFIGSFSFHSAIPRL